MSNITVQNKDAWALVKEQAEAVKKAGLLPSNMTPEQAAIIALKGMELGIGTMRALEGLYVVNGKIAMDAKLIMGLIRERCPQAKITFKRKDDKGCIIEATRPGQETETFSFLEADAHRAQLIKPNTPWTKYPVNMYWARAVTNMGRQLFSDILGASYTPEELGGTVEEQEINPSREVLDVGKSEAKQDLHQPVRPSASLSERINKAKEQTKEVKEQPINKQTGEIMPYPVIEQFDESIVLDDSPEITHWDRLATAGSYTGKTFKQILSENGKEKFLALYEASVKSIARMQQEGKSIPQGTQDTFKDLEACCKEL